MLIWIFTFGFTAILGVLMMWRGWRGCRVGDHPVCARCGFNLTGLPDNSKNCPECGRSLEKPSSTAVGDHHRRYVMFALGVIIFLPAVAIQVVFALGLSKQTDWNTYKPTLWLTLETRSVDTTARSAAFTTLIARIKARDVSSRQIASTIDRGLKIQADLSRPWDPYWSPLLFEARAANIMSDEQWARFARQTMEQCTNIRTRSILRHDTDMPLLIEQGNPRIGRQARFSPVLRVVAMNIGGAKTSIDTAIFRSAEEYLPNFNLLCGGTFPEFAERLKKLPLGHHKGLLRVNLRVPKGPLMGRDGKIEPANLLAESNLEFPFEFDLVDGSTPTIKPLKDPAIKDQVATALSVDPFILMGGRFIMELNCRGTLPANLSHKVYVRDGETEYFVGDVLSPIAVRPGARLDLTNEPDFGVQNDIELSGDKVDIVLRPDPEIAVHRLDIESFLDEEIVLKDVRIQDLTARERQMRKDFEARVKAMEPQTKTRRKF